MGSQNFIPGQTVRSQNNGVSHFRSGSSKSRPKKWSSKSPFDNNGNITGKPRAAGNGVPGSSPPAHGDSNKNAAQHKDYGGGRVNGSTAQRATWSDKVAGKQPFDPQMQVPTENEIGEEDNIWAEGVSDEQVKEAFEALKWHLSESTSSNPLRMPLDLDIAKRTFGILSKVGILLFTTEEAPSRDKVIRWAEEVLIRKMGLQVRRIRRMARKHFLLVLGDSDQREYLLKNTPGRMEGKMIQLSKWSPKYNYKEASQTSKQIWVELPYVDPMITDHGKKMLEKLGPILYFAVVRTNEAKYSHIRACVLMHNIDQLHDSIILELPWGGEYVQEVQYTGLPDQCHKCRERGHWAMNCPLRKDGDRQTTERPADQERSELEDLAEKSGQEVEHGVGTAIHTTTDGQGNPNSATDIDMSIEVARGTLDRTEGEIEDQTEEAEADGNISITALIRGRKKKSTLGRASGADNWHHQSFRMD
ncbi:hypothetical protein R1sor_019573 [Riccia sorocarpa]|uniref:CCHC-type domain-containing protein n=1 Tax=Riccia sorocarpa TaxID=122646 RepID=A0ABD3IDZ5_9MARC